MVHLSFEEILPFPINEILHRLFCLPFSKIGHLEKGESAKPVECFKFYCHLTIEYTNIFCDFQAIRQRK